jgi:hypothetical protein
MLPLALLLFMAVALLICIDGWTHPGAAFPSAKRLGRLGRYIYICSTSEPSATLTIRTESQLDESACNDG